MVNKNRTTFKTTATKSISTPPGWDASSSQGYPRVLNSPVPINFVVIYTPGWREAL